MSASLRPRPQPLRCDFANGRGKIAGLRDRVV